MQMSPNISHWVTSLMSDSRLSQTVNAQYKLLSMAMVSWTHVGHGQIKRLGNTFSSQKAAHNFRCIGLWMAWQTLRLML